MPVTLSQHIQQHHGESLAAVFHAIAAAAVQIEAKLRVAALDDAYGAAGATNVQGEQQQKLDVFANDILSAELQRIRYVAALVSEEDDEPVIFTDRPDAEFVLLFDPLDGSSNIDVNVNVGTIVGVQPMVPGGGAAATALQPGSQQVAALYVNYGPSTQLVYTAGAGTHIFVLNDGDFLLATENARMPEDGPYYSLNEGNFDDLTGAYQQSVTGLRNGALTGTKHGARYVGSLIADFHRTLLKGGVFFYPATKKSAAGKLRLLYEANPLSMIAEQAGGAATDGRTRILGLQPAAPHARTPLVIGSRSEVAAITALVSAE